MILQSCLQCGARLFCNHCHDNKVNVVHVNEQRTMSWCSQCYRSIECGNQCTYYLIPTDNKIEREAAVDVDPSTTSSCFYGAFYFIALCVTIMGNIWSLNSYPGDPMELLFGTLCSGFICITIAPLYVGIT